MLRRLENHKFTWIDAVDLNQSEIRKILDEYRFHELDIEACLEGNQKARIDTYEDYSFIILHFPKYNIVRWIYELNEFNVFLWKDFLITFRDFHGWNVDRIFNFYSNLENFQKQNNIKITTEYVLYEIIQAMLEKMFKVSRINNREFKVIENDVFDTPDSSLVKRIMIKKRNIMIIKNMFKPQVSLFRQLEFVIKQSYKSEMEVYFEDLEDKLGQVLVEMSLLQEYIDSIEDAFKTILDIKTNSVIKILTIFSAFLLPLTLITSFYGMNINLHWLQNEFFVYGLLLLSTLIMVFIYLYMKKTWKI